LIYYIIYVSDQSFLSPKNSFGQGKFIKLNSSSLSSSPIFEYKQPEPSDPNYAKLKSMYEQTLIKKMDLTRITDMIIEYISVKNPEQQELFKVVSPKTLLEIYEENHNPKNVNKIKILKELNKYLEEQHIPFSVIQENPFKLKKERPSIYSQSIMKPTLPSVAAASTELEFSDAESPVRPARPMFSKPSQPAINKPAEPAASTELEFSDAESPVRPARPVAKPAVRKIPLPSLDVNSDNEESESPKKPKK